MNYKVGDSVKIREDLEVEMIHDIMYNMDTEMIKYKGKTAIITSVYDSYYDLDIDNGVWIWTDEMLELPKQRGFKFISTEQMLKDFKDIPMLINTRIKLPQRGTKWSAGYDIFAPYDFTLQPNEEIKIPTGISAYMQPNEVLLIAPRSGLGFKYYCRLSNTLGIIDAKILK